MFFGTLGVAAFAIFAYLTFAFIATCPPAYALSLWLERFRGRVSGAAVACGGRST